MYNETTNLLEALELLVTTYITEAPPKVINKKLQRYEKAHINFINVMTNG